MDNNLFLYPTYAISSLTLYTSTTELPRLSSLKIFFCDMVEQRTTRKSDPSRIPTEYRLLRVKIGTDLVPSDPDIYEENIQALQQIHARVGPLKLEGSVSCYRLSTRLKLYLGSNYIGNSCIATGACVKNPDRL